MNKPPVYFVTMPEGWEYDQKTHDAIVRDLQAVLPEPSKVILLVAGMQVHQPQGLYSLREEIGSETSRVVRTLTFGTLEEMLAYQDIDNADSPTHGEPRMQKVLDRLHDLEKIKQSSTRAMVDNNTLLDGICKNMGIPKRVFRTPLEDEPMRDIDGRDLQTQCEQFVDPPDDEVKPTTVFRHERDQP